MRRSLWAACLAAGLIGGAERAYGQLNDSFVWCEPRTQLTYCSNLTTPRLNQVTDQAAGIWTAGSPWSLTKVGTCTGADIVVQQMNANVFLRILAQADLDTIGTFAQTSEGSEDVGGVIKPCLEQGTITYFPNVFPAGFDPLVLALHEFGHALRLADNRNANDVMRGVGGNAVVLSANDRQNAARSSQAGNINQLHRLIPPDGGVLAFAGYELTLPEGALAAPGTVVGIRPLVASSIPGATLPEGFDQVVVAADLVPEYGLGEFEVGAPFSPKAVELARPATLRVQVTEDTLSDLPAVSPEPLLRLRPLPAIRESLRLARLDRECGCWVPLEASRAADVPTALEAETSSLGTFAVLGRTLEPVTPRLLSNPILLMGGMLGAFGLGLVARRFIPLGRR